MRRKITLFIMFILGVTAGLKAQVHCSFTPSTQFACPPAVISFADNTTGGATGFFWDFDNGHTSSLKSDTASFVQPGVYNIMHIAFNGASRDTMFKQIRIFQPPTDSFSSYDNIGCNSPCHLVHLQNLTIPGESPVTQYVWDFGDGSLAYAGYNAQHCYSQAGTFKVTLVARDSNGCQVSKIVNNYVTIKSGPTGNLSASPNQSCSVPLTVNFTGSGSSPNGPVTYQMFYDNGNTSALPTGSTTYTTSAIYHPVLLITDSLGCVDSAKATVAATVVHAGFKVANQNACSGIPIQFTDTSNYATGWMWDFGDGASATVKNPLHTYSTSGNYTVKLTVTYNTCTDTHTETTYIHVTPPVVFTFMADQTTGCDAPLAVNFTNTATTGSAFLWEFGDGTTATTSTASHTYQAAGSYNVSLSITNSTGCVNKQTVPNYIQIGGLKPKFSVDTTQGCAPLTCHFTDLSTSNVPITSYKWVFGDGGTSFSINPTYTYQNYGKYLPMLIVQNANGCTDTFVGPDTIKVGPTLIPDFTADPLVQCVHQPVSFTNLTAGYGPSTTWFWDFHDGTSTDFSPTHEFSDTGYFDISLTVKNQGCKSDTVKIHYVLIVVPKADFKFKFDCTDPTSVTFTDTSEGAQTWLWEFGDGTTSSQQNPPVHHYPTAGNYKVTLIVTNAVTGCVDSTQKTLPIGPPGARFMADDTVGCLSLVVHFIDSSSFASGWLWSFGDGGTSTQQNPGHIYTDTGRYTVTLVINPGQQCSDTLVKLNYITVYGIKANPTSTPSIGCAPLPVAFTDNSTSYMGNITSWKWYFGTGDSATGRNPSYTYNAPGLYSVILQLEDSHGCKSQGFRTISARNTDAAFVADTILCPGETTHFTDSSTNANAWWWNFGDGDTSVAQNPTHVYNTNGVYSVTLISKNTAYGCKDTFTRVAYIDVDTPKLDFYVLSNFQSCPPFPVQFYNTTIRPGLQYLWYFGDGDTSTARDPLHVYFYPGDYDVTLIGTDSSGCSGSKVYHQLIHLRGPIGRFNATPDTGCAPLEITISGTTIRTIASVEDMGDGTTFNNTINLSHTYQQSGTYYPVFTLTDSLGCQVAYPVDTIVVGYIPYPNLPPDTAVCRGNYVQFNLPLGDHFQWTADQTPTYLSCDTCKSTLSTALDTITYYVTASTNLGCVAKDTITVNVDALPHIFPGLQYRICPNDTLQLHAGQNVAAATWTPNLFISDTNAVNPKVWPPDTTIYRVTGANNVGCTISRIVKVWPITSVVAGLGVHDTTICEGNPVQLQVEVQEASYNDTSFLWSPGKYLSSTVEPTPIASPPPGNYTYNVKVSSSTCVSANDSIHVQVIKKPDIEAGDDKIVAVGTEVQLYAASHEDVRYEWTPVLDSLSCNNCRRPTLNVSGSQTIYVTITNEHGCQTVDSVVLKTVGCDSKMVYVPNTFTPNGDGKNDQLFVRGIGLSKIEYFRIFDRWGRVVFETHNMDEGWDGEVAGKPGDIATYVYLLKGVCTSGSTIDMQGNVTLVR